MGLSARESGARAGLMENQERHAFEQEGVGRSEDVLSGMTDWRAQHPRAPLSAIEAELDGHLARMRARLLERVAPQSTAMTWRQSASDHAGAAPRWPSCKAALAPRGRHRRRLRTNGRQAVARDREYGVGPQCGPGLFPSG